MRFEGREMPRPEGRPRKKTDVYAHYMMDALARLEWDMHHEININQRIPEEWRMIWAERPERKKKRITIGIDEDVLRFFKSMGTGYQTKMNETLKSFMYARLAGFLEGRDAPTPYRDLVKEAPEWGDSQRGFEERHARLEARKAAAKPREC